MITAKSLDRNRPNYIVVFKEAAERNTRTMSTLLKKTAAAGAKSRAERVSLLQAGESGVMTKIYEGIGVAAADLTDEQCNALKKREDVAVVALNQVRFLPPTLRSRDLADRAAGPEPSTSEPLQAYLAGMRDAANAALGFLGQGAAPAALNAPAVFAQQAPQRVTWGLRAMGVTQISAPTGRGVKVAVLDTGIDLTHRDLGSRVMEGQTAMSFVTGVTVQDIFGHGTHCAGTVAGPRQSVSGIRYGVAPDVELLVAKVFNNRPRPGASDDDILEAIEWADESGARIVSMSLGSPRSAGEPFSEAYEVLAAQLLARPSNSILIIAAAGNESERPFATAPVGNPAACPSILAVAAVDRSLRIAEFSCAQLDNIGEVNLSGPGVGVFSATTGDTFETLDGTSMATPHVAGLAALLFESNPSLTAQQAADRLKSRALPLGDARDFGAGLARL
ncbi:MAG: S8 family serine peptidase [Bryobacteraceae bacterium]|nr:S8 family serine peptidase [Bryobacteraceae bacterium]